MPHIINKFIIHKLFGYRDVNMDFSNPYKIIVGENGLGKTTIINCLYYTLSKKFDELAKIKFQKIELHFDEIVIEFTHQVQAEPTLLCNLKQIPQSVGNDK